MIPGLRGDATAACERLARRLERSGAVHPVAGAMALAARGHIGVARQEFADLVGLDVAYLGAVEDGRVPFGRLPTEIDWVLAEIDGLDLLALADLAVTTRCGTGDDAWQNDPSCSDV